MNTWYSKFMPKIDEVKVYLQEEFKTLKLNNNISKIYVWGSFAEKLEKGNEKIKDTDIVIQSNINSGDFISLDGDIITYNSQREELEENGYNCSAIKLTKDILKINKFAINKWLLSEDKKLLHWGPVFENIEENLQIKKEAEDYAVNVTGIKSKDFNKTSQKKLSDWYNLYKEYLNYQHKNVPDGWYETNVEDISKILTEFKEI